MYGVQGLIHGLCTAKTPAGVVLIHGMHGECRWYLVQTIVRGRIASTPLAVGAGHGAVTARSQSRMPDDGGMSGQSGQWLHAYPLRRARVAEKTDRSASGRPGGWHSRGVVDPTNAVRRRVVDLVEAEATRVCVNTGALC